MNDIDIDTEIQDIATESRKTFDMMETIKGRTMKTGAVTVYTDEPLADELGGFEDLKNVAGFVVSRDRWGVLGEIDERLSEDPKADIADLEAQAVELRVQLALTGIQFHLRAVPEIVSKVARRETMKALGIKGKVPAGDEMHFDEVYRAHMLAKTIFKAVDAEGAESEGELSPKAAGDLEGYLPRSEFAKLYAKLQHVQFKQSISSSVTAESDF